MSNLDYQKLEDFYLENHVGIYPEERLRFWEGEYRLPLEMLGFSVEDMLEQYELEFLFGSE